MKTARFICTIAAVVFATFSAGAAEPPTDELALKFAAVDDVYDMARRQLGRDALDAVIFIDLRRNLLKLDDAHPGAAKIRALIEAMDRRPETIKVSATIKRIIPATAAAPAREVVIASPKVVAVAGKPMTLMVDDGTDGKLSVELVVSPVAK